MILRKKHVLRALDYQGLRIAFGVFRTSPIKSLYAEAGELSLEYRGTKLACIQGNKNVDKLAKAALNRASSSEKRICWSDLKPKINVYIHTVWQENWDAEGTNKLHAVLPNLGEDLSKRGERAGRKRETVMCRLRVGHKWLTQS
ncbi:ribonuclease hi [Plakobranchus ocellatus]|uniref:Ribonuclease hi n=1 Tax=Plakobranchus ocellatus TaxID=259542 RepID=A0AAV4C2W4_9GAST|nr:ribonuclease hi [Plakobranchus ocellatus]